MSHVFLLEFRVRKVGGLDVLQCLRDLDIRQK